MYKLLATTLVLASSTTQAEQHETPRTIHCIGPKAFYQNHNEVGYKYSTYGGGFEYTLANDTGINIRLSGITDGKKNSTLVECEETIFYKIPFMPDFRFYPVASNKSSSHHVLREDHKDYYVRKSTLYLGMGIEWKPENLAYSVEGQVFRDLHNAILVQEKDNFWGKKYSNPAGFRIGLRISEQFTDELFFDVAGHYSKTFNDCYKEMGMELALRWRI